MLIEDISVNKLKFNKGQIKGVPKNPRFIKDDKYKKLKQSIIDNPEMLKLREVVAYDTGTELVVIGGNMRARACIELGYKEIPTKVIETNSMTAEQIRAFIIKDNVSFGDTDWDLLANEWNAEELDAWGVDVIKTDFSDIDSFFKNNEEEGGDKKHQKTTCPECGHIFDA